MDNFFPNELISLLNSNTRGRVELGRIDLMKNFSFFEVDEKEAGNVVKALNRANWNGRKVSVEIAGEEGKETPKGRRKSEGSSYGKKEFDGKKRSFKDEKRSNTSGKRNDTPRNSEVNLTMLRLTKRKANRAAKNVAILVPVARKTIGGNSSKMTIRSSAIKNLTSVKKVGQDGHRKRNNIQGKR